MAKTASGKLHFEANESQKKKKLYRRITRLKVELKIQIRLNSIAHFELYRSQFRNIHGLVMEMLVSTPSKMTFHFERTWCDTPRFCTKNNHWRLKSSKFTTKPRDFMQNGSLVTENHAFEKSLQTFDRYCRNVPDDRKDQEGNRGRVQSLDS